MSLISRLWFPLVSLRCSRRLCLAHPLRLNALYLVSPGVHSVQPVSAVYPCRPFFPLRGYMAPFMLWACCCVRGTNMWPYLVCQESEAIALPALVTCRAVCCEAGPPCGSRKGHNVTALWSPVPLKAGVSSLKPQKAPLRAVRDIGFKSARWACSL